MASTKRDTAPDPERLIGAWRDAAADARRWRDDPDRVAALKAARTASAARTVSFTDGRMVS